MGANKELDFAGQRFSHKLKRREARQKAVERRPADVSMSLHFCLIAPRVRLGDGVADVGS
ncbi:MAG: hypothetical protein LBU32_18065 [Clostridiales bacterium]|jgi:hypothetical protein|nr:hypothetical protein [Clostridiales bacterium]